MTKHDEFKMPFMVTTEECSEIILTSVAKRKKVVMFPFMMKILSLLNYILPVFIYDILIPFLAKDKRKKEAKIF